MSVRLSELQSVEQARIKPLGAAARSGPHKKADKVTHTWVYPTQQSLTGAPVPARQKTQLLGHPVMVQISIMARRP